MNRASPLHAHHPAPVPPTSYLSFPTRDTFTDIKRESARTLAAAERQEHEWIERFPKSFRPDIEFLLNHPSGQTLKTHQCMGVAYTHTFQTADHTRVTPHTLLAAELALNMARHLRLQPTDSRDIVAAVAGHDQGHIFASHQSEYAINSFPEFDGTPGRPTFCHEHRTKQLFESAEFSRYFGEERVERITSILYDASHPYHLLVDWADRLAYLMVDSVHIGDQDIIDRCHIQREFIESLQNLPDGTIGFRALNPALSLIQARDLLYDRVSIGRASSLFTGFLVEAFHRVIAATGQPITRFVNELSEKATPEARRLFLEVDVPRLYCPNQHPTRAKPVDLDHRAVCHVTLDMLTERGRAWAIDFPPLSSEATIPACLRPRANMSRFEHLVRNALSSSSIPGFLELCGGVVGISHMPPKQYHLRTFDQTSGAREVLLHGKEKWEFFIGMPSTHGGARGIHEVACEALIQEGLIQAESVDRLRQLPSSKFFTHPS